MVLRNSALWDADPMLGLLIVYITLHLLQRMREIVRFYLGNLPSGSLLEFLKNFPKETWPFLAG